MWTYVISLTLFPLSSSMGRLIINVITREYLLFFYINVSTQGRSSLIYLQLEFKQKKTQNIRDRQVGYTCIYTHSMCFDIHYNRHLDIVTTRSVLLML